MTDVSDHTSLCRSFVGFKMEESGFYGKSENFIDLRELAIDNPVELSKEVYKIIESAPSGSVIMLPPKHITVPKLDIKEPIYLQGAPGSLIEIKNGGIVIDFKNHSSTNKSIFSELSIIFNINVKRTLDHYKSQSTSKLFQSRDSALVTANPGTLKECIIPLIMIENNTHAEFRDCDIRSVKTE